MTADLWSERAETYRGLADQRAGDDLELLVSWAEGRSALDVATGGGHTANRLREAGFDDELAWQLAVDGDVDLHDLLKLVDQGCPPDLAARILAQL